MKRLVLKFGGTSVGTIEKIKKVANIIKKRLSEGNQIIVVVSAMSGVTDELKAQSDLISENFDTKELDVLLASGEQASCSLLSSYWLKLWYVRKCLFKIPIMSSLNNKINLKQMEINHIIHPMTKKVILAVIKSFKWFSSFNSESIIEYGSQYWDEIPKSVTVLYS